MKVVSFERLKPDYGIALSRSRIYRLVKEGGFPAPIKIGTRSIAFIQSEIEAYLEAKAKARPDCNAPSTEQASAASGDDLIGLEDGKSVRIEDVRSFLAVLGKETVGRLLLRAALGVQDGKAA